MKLLKALYDRTPSIVFVLVIVSCIGFSVMRGSTESAQRCRAVWGAEYCAVPLWEKIIGPREQ